MARKIGLLPIVAAAVLAAAGCSERPADAPPAHAGGAETKAPQTPGGRPRGPTGGACAGIVGTQCAAAADFCKLPEGQCGFPDVQGTCTARPQVCTREYRPVCGCDGMTYGNACAADAAGVSVQSPGECPEPPAG